jgi:cytochrome c oxidase subunit 2
VTTQPADTSYHTDLMDKLGSFWLPPVISPETSGQDVLFYVIYYLSVFFFFLVVGFMVYFAWKYRKKPGQVPSNIEGNTKLEIIWSVIPGILFIGIFVWGLISWIGLNIPPQEAMDVKVTARKWDWLFTDMNSGAETNDLIVPVNTPVRLIMSSVDVIHGFYIPDFRINKDVLPNQYSIVWFKAERKGIYPIYCSQYCGTKHSQMIRYVRVVDEADYLKMMEDAQGAGLSPMQLGEKLFKGKGACASCHDATQAKTRIVGPPLWGMFGTDVTYDLLPSKMKKTDKFDENYIRKSILDPNFREIDGYPNVMPSYQGQLKEQEVDALIEYIKSLK